LPLSIQSILIWICLVLCIGEGIAQDKKMSPPEKGGLPSDSALYYETRKLPKCDTEVTIKGLPFHSVIYANANDLKQGFSLIVRDSTFGILYFFLGYNCRGCDYWGQVISGNKVSPDDVIILNQLKPKETLDLASFKIERNGKTCTLPEVSVVLIEKPGD
jgi:hypothetical protein